MLTPIFYFDNDGYFSRIGRAQKLEDGSILMPSNATQVKPDDEKLKDHFAKWNKDSGVWEYEAKPTSAADFVGVRVSHKSQTEHDRELRQLLQDLVKADSEHFKVIRGTKEEGLYWSVEAIPEKTQDEKDLETAKQEEQELLQKLRDTDYIAVKIAEGAVTEEEASRYEEIKAQRQEWRDQVNALRASQETLTAKIAEANA